MANDVQRVNGLTVYRFPAAQLGVYGRVAGLNQFTPTTPDEAIAYSGALAALDGPMFEFCPGTDPPGSSEVDRYRASTCDRPQALVYDMARSVSYAGSRSGQGITVSIVNGSAVVLGGSSVAPGATVAIQLYPALVQNGTNVASNAGSNADTNQRAGLAVFPDGTLAFVIGTMDMQTFADRIIGLGASHAGYTDGGGSTALVTQTAYYGASERRRVPIWLVANQPGVFGGSSSDDTILIFGGTVLLAIGAFAAYTAWQERRGGR